MKKQIVFLLTFALAFSCTGIVGSAGNTGLSGAGAAAAQADVSIRLSIGSPTAVVNGAAAQIDAENAAVVPYIVNDTTLVPLRFIAETLDFHVAWDEQKQSAVLTGAGADTSIEVTAGSPTVWVNGASAVLGTAPVLDQNRLFVPVRIAEYFSCGVEWNAYENEVIIRQEHLLDSNAPDVQKLYFDALDRDAFLCFYDGYCDISLWDREDNIMGGLMRELFSVLSLEELEDKHYTDAQARGAIEQFLSTAGDEAELSRSKLILLRSALEWGETFGDTATEEQLVGTVPKSELEQHSLRLFGLPLPDSESHVLPVSYASFFLYSRTNMLHPLLPPAFSYDVYYNSATQTYLFTRVMAQFIQTSAQLFSQHQAETQLLKATKHNDEISLYVSHWGEYGEYSGGTSEYQGTYKNTYRKVGDQFHWISSYGVDDKTQ